LSHRQVIGRDGLIMSTVGGPYSISALLPAL
jgi:hypothetical protein